VIFGTFGLRPHLDGSLNVAPSYHHELGRAHLTGYRFRGHSYDVVLGPRNYEVSRDGKIAIQADYGAPIEFSPGGGLKEPAPHHRPGIAPQGATPADRPQP
jgi:hypothetical protein